MEDICPVCHLPKSICTCGARSKEQQQIKIYVVKKKFKKFMTKVSGISSESEAKEIGKYLKNKLACGGTVKKTTVEIQGNQKDRVKELLIKKGFLEDMIDA